MQYSFLNASIVVRLGSALANKPAHPAAAEVQVAAGSVSAKATAAPEP
jgi:hypothetical protein